MQIKKNPAPKGAAGRGSRDEADARAKSDEFAAHIARTFKDEARTATYKAYCRNFPLEVVRQAFDRVKAVPSERVKRSRLALFIYLLKTHEDNKK